MEHNNVPQTHSLEEIISTFETTVTTTTQNNNDSSTEMCSQIKSSQNRWQITTQFSCITCQTEIWVDEKTVRTTCKEFGEEQYVARPCCSEPTSNKRFPVNINEQHTVCSDYNSDMVRLPCCRQFRTSLKLDNEINNIYDSVNCSKYSVACTCTNINCLPPKGSSWKCKKFTCGQFTVYCDCGRLTYQDLKSKYNCICGYEFEYDIETGIAT